MTRTECGEFYELREEIGRLRAELLVWQKQFAEVVEVNELLRQLVAEVVDGERHDISWRIHPRGERWELETMELRLPGEWLRRAKKVLGRE